MSTETIDKCYGYLLIQRIIYGCLGISVDSEAKVIHAKYLFSRYRRGTWQDRAYRAIWYACPEKV